MKLQKLKIENFKGIKAFELNLDGNAVIKGANGTGKTTVYDAFLWVLFGKDSSGRKDFELRPLDAQNVPVKGLTLRVEAFLEIGGKALYLIKEQQERLSKGDVKGFTNLCWINEVPKKVGEYESYIKSVIPEDTFKVLTDLRYFNTMHWKERRSVLLDVAGDIGTPTGFEELLANLSGRTMKEYEDMLKSQRKRHKKERDEINPRIDEIQRGLSEYVKDDNLTIRRDAVLEELSAISSERTALFESEQERQQKNNEINGLKGDKIKREGELKNDTAGVKAFLEEKAEIEKALAQCKQKMSDAAEAVKEKTRDKDNATINLERCTAKIAELGADWKAVKNLQFSGETICPTCQQNLPPEKIKEVQGRFEANKTEQLENIAKLGNGTKDEVATLKADIEIITKEHSDLTAAYIKAKDLVSQGEEYKAKKFPELDRKIEARETPPPMQDEKWKQISANITRLESELGESVGEQLTKIDQKIQGKQDELAEFDKALARADEIEKAKTRIEELEALEKDLSQKIATLDKGLKDIADYKQTESKFIESAVNDRFKLVEFKLFNELLNGESEDCCEATLEGVPYSDMSYGQKIIVGIDIVNVLSKHYGFSAPLFVDNSESVTYPIEADSQTIKLFAEENINELKVEKG
jgi:DNA repair exonuclease SbcCD ATPase subunit